MRMARSVTLLLMLELSWPSRVRLCLPRRSSDFPLLSLPFYCCLLLLTTTFTMFTASPSTFAQIHKPRQRCCCHSTCLGCFARMGAGTTNANGMQVRFSARSILPQQQQCIPDQIAPSFAGKFVVAHSFRCGSMWIFLNF